MKSLFKSLLTVIVIIAAILLVLWGILRLLSWAWLSSDMPSSGIWQYQDDDLEIIIYVPEGGGVNTSDGCYKCKVDITYSGKKQSAVIVYHGKMYQYYIKYVYNYDNIMKPDININRIGEIISSTYHIRAIAGEWELKEIRTNEALLKDYEGKNLILKKIGKYRDPE